MYNHTLPVSVFVTLLFFLSSASLSLSLSHFGCLSVSGIVSHCLVLSLFVSPSSTTLTKACEGGKDESDGDRGGSKEKEEMGFFFPLIFFPFCSINSSRVSSAEP